MTLGHYDSTINIVMAIIIIITFKTHLNSFNFIREPDYARFYRLHCTVFIRSYCSLFTARLSRYTSAYSLVVRYCSESSRHRYWKMKMR